MIYKLRLQSKIKNSFSPHRAKYRNLKSKIFCIILFFLLIKISFSQNLILNPSFEQIWVCPHTYITEINAKPFPEWINPNNGTPDVFHPCSDFNASVPVNFGGFLHAADGNAYSGLVLWENFISKNKEYNVSSREYLQTQLSEPLKINKLYCVKFQYANAKKTLFSINRLGVAITKQKINSKKGNLIIQRPQIINDPTHIMDNTDWVEFSGIFRAKGKEQYLTIGNFFDNSQTNYLVNDRSDLDSSLVYAYYYIDNVQVYEINYESECGCLNNFAFGYDPLSENYDPETGYNSKITNYYSLNQDGIAINGERGTDERTNGRTDERETAEGERTNGKTKNGLTNECETAKGVNEQEKQETRNKSQDENSSMLISKSEIDENKIINSKIGDKFLLNRIFFEFNSSELLAISNFELDKLFEILNTNTAIKIEIRGHTDDIGTDKYNKTLSIKRAESVYNYLLIKGINKTRMKFRGFGNTVPLYSNETEDGRSKNRRVEILIMEK
ncbi:MAG: OmpA family protein [Bacteroidales bacterium]|jgi:outer membrane protein OmpA-like peptidoglycan-associated protein|nr:OmpA family protein [Bacteroidales bacterium]